MKPYEFSNANLVLTKPASMTDDECGSLSAFKGVDDEGRPYIVVGFLPTKKDIQAMIAGMPIQIKFLGNTIQPVSLFTENADGSINPENEEEVKVCQNEDNEAVCSDCPCTCNLKESKEHKGPAFYKNKYGDDLVRAIQFRRDNHDEVSKFYPGITIAVEKSINGKSHGLTVHCMTVNEGDYLVLHDDGGFIVFHDHVFKRTYTKV